MWWWLTRLTLACVLYVNVKVGLISTQAHASQFGGVPFILPPNQGVGISLQAPAACHPCVYTPYHDLTSICKTNSSLRKMIPQERQAFLFPTLRPSRGCVNFWKAKQVLTGRIIEKNDDCKCLGSQLQRSPPHDNYIGIPAKGRKHFVGALPLSCIFFWVKTQKWSEFSIDSYFLTDS